MVLFIGPWFRDTSVLCLIPAVSPFIMLGSLLALQTVGVLTVFAIPVFILAWMTPRGFCRYMCPVGLLQDGLARWRTKAGPQPCPAVGTWLALLTIGSACVGYPLFLWLDPLALFAGFLNAWHRPLTSVALLAGLGLPLLILLLDALRPGGWCARFCPAGSMQDLLTIMRCHRQRIIVPFAGRRAFLVGCAGAAGALLIKTTRGQALSPLRPPGAVDETHFPGACIRCGNCAKACPSRIITPDLRNTSLATLLTPTLHFDTDYCREDCHRCSGVCPSGAIARISLTQKKQRVIGFAQVELDHCLLANGKECTACRTHCPFNAVQIRSSDGGFTTCPTVDYRKCTGCGACEVICPARPHRAIRVFPISNRLNT